MQSLADSRRGTAVQGRQRLSDEVEACLDAEDITALVGLEGISHDALILLVPVSDELKPKCRSSLPSAILFSWDPWQLQDSSQRCSRLMMTRRKRRRRLSSPSRILQSSCRTGWLQSCRTPLLSKPA